MQMVDSLKLGFCKLPDRETQIEWLLRASCTRIEENEAWWLDFLRRLGLPLDCYMSMRTAIQGRSWDNAGVRNPFLFVRTATKRHAENNGLYPRRRTVQSVQLTFALTPEEIDGLRDTETDEDFHVLLVAIAASKPDTIPDVPAHLRFDHVSNGYAREIPVFEMLTQTPEGEVMHPEDALDYHQLQWEGRHPEEIRSPFDQLLEQVADEGLDWDAILLEAGADGDLACYVLDRLAGRRGGYHSPATRKRFERKRADLQKAINNEINRRIEAVAEKNRVANSRLRRTV